MSSVFVAPAAGGARYQPAPPEKPEHEVETPNPAGSALLHSLGFGLLATALEVMEMAEEASPEKAPGMQANPTAFKPEDSFKPGRSFRPN